MYIKSSDPSILSEDSNESALLFEEFYEDVFIELSRYGDIDQMKICDNIGAHLRGNVYVKFFSEDDAAKAIKAINGRFYNGRVIQAELSPVTDLKDATCAQFTLGLCNRGSYCSFMHLLSRDHYQRQYDYSSNRSRSRSRSRSSSPVTHEEKLH